MNFLFHQGALGDWVLTFGLLRALRPVTAVSARSKAQLAATLLADVTAADSDEPDLARLFVEGGAAQTSAAWRARLGAANLVVSMVSDGRDAWAANVRRMLGAGRLAIVDPRPPADWSSHVVQWHARQLEALGIEPVAAPPGRPRRAADPIVVHPGSGGAAKCWPPQRFESLCAALRAEGRTVRVLLGEVEAARWPADQVRHWERALGARVLETLEDLAAQLDEAGLCVGNDAGPTHLAAAMGVPTIALFGPTDPARWAPQGPAVRVLAPARPAPMTWLAVELVLAACRATR